MTFTPEQERRLATIEAADMAPEALVERVARAIWSEDGADVHWEALAHDSWLRARYRRLARAAVDVVTTRVAGAPAPDGEAVMTANCSTCRHWNRDRTDFQMVVGAGYHPDQTNEEREDRWARADVADQLFGRCDAIHMGPADVDDLPLAVAMDGSEYMADLYTRAEFGCVLHEDTEPDR